MFMVLIIGCSSSQEIGSESKEEINTETKNTELIEKEPIESILVKDVPKNGNYVVLDKNHVVPEVLNIQKGQDVIWINQREEEFTLDFPEENNRVPAQGSFRTVFSETGEFIYKIQETGAEAKVIVE